MNLRGARSSRWWGALSALLLVGSGLFATGCGHYEPEVEYPQNYVEPPTAAELEARQAQQQAAVAPSEGALAQPAEGDIAIGDSGGDEYSDTDPSALTEFRTALDGHGAWVEDPTYGTVWVPASSEVGSDFQPYVTAGHWTYDDGASWVWVSDYDWGWAPFHYGRWVHLPGHGWAWIPGRTYSGAWVVWRTGGPDYGYVGWAPAPPSWYWYHGVAVGWSFGWYSPYYVYCPHSYVYHPHVHGYVVRGDNARYHDAHTRPYVPANPAPGNRQLATPEVGGPRDRVVAKPGVGGSGGSVEGRRVASPTVNGPKPNELGIKAETVVAPPRNNQGLARAEAFSAPRTAVAQGARPPSSTIRPTVATPGGPGGNEARPNNPLIGSRLEPAARSPQYMTPSTSPGGAQAVPPRSAALPPIRPQGEPDRSAFNAPGYRPSSPSVSSPTPSYRSSPSVSSSPSYRSSPSVSSSPSFRSSPSVSSPSRSSSPSFRSSPSVSSPSRSSSSPSRSSSPSFRSSPSRAPTRR